MLSMKRTARLARVITRDEVLTPSPKKRTPFIREPSVKVLSVQLVFSGAKSEKAFQPMADEAFSFCLQ